MSLTSYLTDPAHQEIRTKFRKEFLRPAFNFENEIKAHPLTPNYGIIGTAFDYLLRFTIQHCNKEKEIHCSGWVADIAYKQLEYSFAGEEQSTFKKRYQRAKKNHDKFINTGKISNQLIADSLFLAKLDLYVRAGIIAADLFEENDLDIKDLKKLLAAINISDFLFRKKCFLNPTFGKGSAMVGGADADMILDDTLIEIKVTKHLKLEREHLNQLIGYYILALVGGINKVHQGSSIKRVGIYFARHGLLWTISLSEFGNSKKFEVFKTWFVGYFDNIRKDSLIESQKRIKNILNKMTKEEQIKLRKKTRVRI